MPTAFIPIWNYQHSAQQLGRQEGEDDSQVAPLPPCAQGRELNTAQTPTLKCRTRLLTCAKTKSLGFTLTQGKGPRPIFSRSACAHAQARASRPAALLNSTSSVGMRLCLLTTTPAPLPTPRLEARGWQIDSITVGITPFAQAHVQICTRLDAKGRQRDRFHHGWHSHMPTHAQAHASTLKAGSTIEFA
jgi:hypothetical protein